MSIQISKIDQAAFTRNLVIEKGLIDNNTNIIPMKTNFSIEIIELDNYEKAEFWPYQYFIGKLMYLTYGTRLDIVCVIKQVSRYNAELRKSYLQAARRVV